MTNLAVKNIVPFQNFLLPVTLKKLEESFASLKLEERIFKVFIVFQARG
jgi:hypothetical protein